MIRRFRYLPQQTRPRRRLRRILDRAVARCGTGLRRERVHAQRPEGPALSGQRPPMPARALSAQVKLAHPVDPIRRADRGAAPITGLIHLLPPSGPSRAQVPGPLHRSDCSLRHICCPGSAPLRPSGTTARSRSWFARRRSSSCLSDAAPRRPTRPVPGPGVLIGGGVDVQRRPGGSGRDSAGRDGGSAGRRAGQDDLQVAAVTARAVRCPGAMVVM